VDIREVPSTLGVTLVIYVFLLVMLRVAGKRALGNLSAFDLVITFIVGHVAAEPILDESLHKTLLTVFGLVGFHVANSYVSFRSAAFNRLTGGVPRELVRDGRIIQHALGLERISQDALWSLLRQQQIDELGEIRTAALEPNGSLSILKTVEAKDAQKSDLERILGARGSGS
jgi:uncharacterized membrane protein YcaP (DUF421 family)